ncbi:hypothetical protein MPS_4646 [Mycobacterium pseudoshottsii JCM 15466]|nr:MULTISPECIES: hypothetical protein [Mycobacterium ulcerans group]MBC9862812.1 hypothetical protein [Mycobacterium pseudoshottsii]RFZ63701.1 hypothetical protein DL240490_02717 [Mycobacterium marinum]BBA87895.1 hypothetical protein MPSD_23490 [Mycobacterium pseudoshottsii JCM 15466]GAQ39353.1 hypothetical protein MPS_4646 [Mycobacterium pseudoshottsii JCM 15466]
MTAVECDASPWLVQLQDALHCVGYAVVEDVLDAGFLATTRDRMYLVQERILSEIGQERRAPALLISRLVSWGIVD